MNEEGNIDIFKGGKGKKKSSPALWKIITIIMLIALIDVVNAVPLSDQQHGNWLQRASIIISPPTYTLSGIYYDTAIGNCAADVECTSFYANEPGKIYVWVDGTGWGGTMIGHPGFQTLVKITSQDVSVEWGEGTATFLPPLGSYIKVPVIVNIPSSQIGQTSARVYQSILLNGIVQPNGFAMWQNYWLPAGTSVQASLTPIRSTPTPTPIQSPSATGTVIIWSNPTDAVVSVDGVQKGTTAGSNWLSIDMNAGTYTVKVSKSGYETYTQEVIVVNGGQAKVEARLSQIVQGTPTATPAPTSEQYGCPSGSEPRGVDANNKPICVKPKVIPGFEALFAIAGLVAIAYLVLRQGKRGGILL